MKNDQKDVSTSSTKEKKAVKNKATKSAKAAKKKTPNKIIKFFKDLKSEIKKVVWPSKKTVWNNTGVVLVAMLVAGVFVWGIDSIFTLIIDLILGR